MPVASVGTLAVGTLGHWLVLRRSCLDSKTLLSGTLASVETLLSRLKELSGTLASVGPEVPVVSQLSS